MLIYIAGPLRSENENEIIKNVTRAVKVGGIVFDLGHECIIPHLFWYSHRLIGWPVDDDQALSYCYRLVKRCDALLRMPGKSDGADKELMILAKENRPLTYLQNVSREEIERCLKMLEKESVGEITRR